MKALLTFKPLPDLSMLSEHDWIPNEQRQLNIDHVRSTLSCFDETAAELLLRAQAADKSLKLEALAFNDSMVEYHLKLLLALGFERASRLMAPAGELSFNPLANATILANYLQHEHYSLVVLGMQFGDADDGQTAAMLAEILGWPHLNQVSDFTLLPTANSIRVSRTMETEVQHFTITLPAVLAVGNSTQAAALRIPTLKQKLAASRANIAAVAPEFCPVEQVSSPILESLTSIGKQRKTQWLEGKTPQEKALKLYDLYLRERINV
ncbi:electron transfer flavoprotein subunit beta/FixA family protein [Hafnia alvei]|uniref:Electron transfer flavoprotein beta subunit n=1 Tax=Hafnia alvei TaxID=569 RepID=A0A1C6Z338_HAFAL|nr:hypothetical protein [Hafnia alvei]NLS52586.1 hypothetical protein [Hafnia alvei]SCM53388.1 electron transfer flavoprotein beta subunit [Hafnia alvei]